MQTPAVGAVFINLLINARDAIEERWGVAEAGQGLKRIVIGTRAAVRVVVCEICDTGVGVPVHMTERIFEPFFTTKQAGKGTGLGLSISYGIVKDCRGVIRVRTNPIGGACFVLEFIPEKTHGKEDLLVMMKDIRDVLRLPLSDLGYEVLEAENGEDALHLFKDARPPIILTDIKMPGMDGIELLQKVKLENTETEVIMITGHGDMDLAVRSLKCDATDFITKPINVDVLEIALRRAAERILPASSGNTWNLERLVASELQATSLLGLMLGSISHALRVLLTGLDAGVYMVDKGLVGATDPATGRLGHRQQRID
jgi:signal transduction histidine kinase